jgi:hypothetical protein
MMLGYLTLNEPPRYVKVKIFLRPNWRPMRQNRTRCFADTTTCMPTGRNVLPRQTLLKLLLGLGRLLPEQALGQTPPEWSA